MDQMNTEQIKNSLGYRIFSLIVDIPYGVRWIISTIEFCVSVAIELPAIYVKHWWVHRPKHR